MNNTFKLKEESVVAWLGLGSNRGDILQNLTRAALDLSVLPGSSLHAVSSVYESEPVGLGYSNAFLNAVVGLSTRLKPGDLLECCQSIEARHGRDRREGDRTLDIDILLYGGEQHASSDLQVPHPRLTERRFVLEPLCEVADSLKHPELGATICSLANRDAIQAQQVNRLDQTLMPAWGC